MQSIHYREEDGVKALSGSELNIRVVLGSGSASARLLTSDLTTEYVEINANYRT
ncbi:MAG: bifunctional ornithine acetyltransferase/N-acetylglutamate synthase [Candidatus Oxydemutatoraceae bacterium WSBS_2016_MAG_OTU14]